MIRVFLADAHAVFRQALARLLADEADIRVMGEAGVGEGTLTRIRQTPCNVCLLEPFEPVEHGMELLRLLRHECPDLPLLVLSGHSEQKEAIRCIGIGARGYLCKTSDAATVVAGIRQVAAGEMVLSPGTTRNFALTLLTDNPDPYSRLSDREKHIFHLLVAGCPVSQVARELQVSVKTVSTHKSRIQQKLGCNGIATLVRFALQHELLDHPQGKS